MAAIASRTRSKSKRKQEEEAISLWKKVPDEIIHDEIFLKLPAKSILSSRCVCKLFNNLLSKPNFIKNHVNLSILNKNNPKLLFLRFSDEKLPPMIYSTPIDRAASISSTQDVFINYPFQSHKNYFLQLLGSCNGLICIKICKANRVYYLEDYEETNYFIILNPFTRQFKEFRMQTVSKYGHGIAYGFGYDSDIDDYKLVAISDSETIGCSKFEVYNVRSGSLSTIESTVSYSFYSGQRTRGLYFNGRLHWLGFFMDSHKTLCGAILCYDISNGMMVNMPLPENIVAPTGIVGEVYRTVGVWGNCLCVSLVWDHVGIAHVWVMQQYGVKESWVKKHTITQLRSSHLTILWKILWSSDDEVLMDYDGERLLSFNPTTETVRSVARDLDVNGRETYVESIASLNSDTYLVPSLRLLSNSV